MSESNPFFPFHSESDRDYHAWVGLYIHAWSALECGLYNVIQVLRVLRIEPEPAANKGIPLNAKLKLLRKAFSDNSSLSREAEEMIAIANLVERESLFRHNLIHGVNTKIDKVEPWHTLMWRPEQSGLFSEPEDVLQVAQPDLEEHYHQIGMTIFKLMGLCRRLLDNYTRNEK